MRDYDELVKALRENAEWAEGNIWEVPIMLPDNLKQAADAIEELTREYESMAKSVNEAAEILRKSKPKWISVEERLPEENGRYLVRYKRDIVLDYIEVHDDEVRIMRFFVDDGWRYPFLCQPELRKAEHQTVTHWMELPILPAEDNENG